MQAITYRTADGVIDAMNRVYGHMSLAVLISMAMSWAVGTSPELLKFFFTGLIKWVVIFAPLVMILAMVFIQDRFNKTQLQAFLYVFAALMGLSMATVFAVFTTTSVITAFLGAGVLFGTMSLYGYLTRKSLDNWGSFLMVGVIAIILASVINLFLGNTLLQMVISGIAIIVFLGLTAYDTQKIREIVSQDTDTGREEVLGALNLYLDFVNLFIHLLQLFGNRK